MKRLPIIAILTLLLNSILQAGPKPPPVREITAGGVRFKGDTQTISAYAKAREAFEVQKKIMDDIQERYKNKTATMAELNATQEQYRLARNAMLALELKLDVVPTKVLGKPEDLKPEAARVLYAEAEKVGNRLESLRTQKLDKAAHTARLKKLLSTFESHPAEGKILRELASLNEDSPETAATYYRKIVASTFPSDRWNFAGQHACKRLAFLYEKNKEYQKAIDVLKQWKVCEPCGTGRATSQVKKRFWILRLSLHTRKPDEVRKEMWSALADGTLSWWAVGHDGLAKHIMQLYGDNEMELLKADLKRTLKSLGNAEAKSDAGKRKRDIDKVGNLLMEMIRKNARGK